MDNIVFRKLSECRHVLAAAHRYLLYFHDKAVLFAVLQVEPDAMFVLHVLQVLLEEPGHM